MLARLNCAALLSMPGVAKFKPAYSTVPLTLLGRKLSFGSKRGLRACLKASENSSQRSLSLTGLAVVLFVPTEDLHLPLDGWHSINSAVGRLKIRVKLTPITSGAPMRNYFGRIRSVIAILKTKNC